MTKKDPLAQTPALTADQSAMLRRLPAVGDLLESAADQPPFASLDAKLVVEALRVALDQARQGILRGERAASPDGDALLAAAARYLDELVKPTLHPVINATGVIIHTNLGRAPLSRAAVAAMTAAATGYSTLEFDIDSGQRGSRSLHAAELLQQVTGAPAATVVNNAAAAVLLMLTTLCHGREVIISRGQLVEIGGGFRVPDIMAQSGAKLVEVGTTNRTHLRDYEAAINENTAAILVAHHSNFKIIGFTSEPPLDELAQLAHAHDIPLLFDQGSGCLLDTTPFGLEPEPTVQDGLAAGCDLIACSGDKLLGGPQAGLLLGREDLVAACKRHPLARAVRPDKLCLAGLGATLTHYLKREAESEVPVWWMMGRTPAEIERLALHWAAKLAENNMPAAVVDGESTIGGGSLPGTTLPTRLLAIDHPHPAALAAVLRRRPPHLVGRIKDERLLFDPRTVLPDQEEALLAALLAGWHQAEAERGS